MFPNPKDAHMPVPHCLQAPSGGWQPITVRAIRLLVAKVDGDLFVGRCLEHDVLVQGKSYKDLAEAVTHVLVTQAIIDQSEGIEQLSTLKPAPQEYWAAWQLATQQRIQSSVVQVGLVRPEDCHRHDSAEHQRQTSILVDFALADQAHAA